MIRKFIFLCGVILGTICWSATMDEVAPALVETIAKRLVEKGKPKVAALDFTDLRGRPNELGRYLADHLAVEFVMADGISVIDRANIKAIMDEHKLTAEGLVRPENAKKLGEFAGVDVILTGNLAVMDGQVTLTVKGIATETAEVVAAGRMKFDMTEDLQRMMGLSIASTSAVGAATGSGAAASASQLEAIAVREYGSLIVVLKDVQQVRGGRDGDELQIRCTFEFQNRGIQHAQVIAGNGTAIVKRAWDTGNNVSEVLSDVSSARFSLTDTAGTSWNSLKGQQRGLPLVMGFEASEVRHGNQRFKQQNPSAITTYIRKGVHFNYTGNPVEGMNWLGGFRPIPPGERVIASIVFAPVKERSSRSKAQFPTSFQIEMEILTGELTQGKEQKVPDNLSLKLVTFDRVSFPEKK